MKCDIIQIIMTLFRLLSSIDVVVDDANELKFDSEHINKQSVCLRSTTINIFSLSLLALPQ